MNHKFKNDGYFWHRRCRKGSIGNISFCYFTAVFSQKSCAASVHSAPIFTVFFSKLLSQRKINRWGLRQSSQRWINFIRGRRCSRGVTKNFLNPFPWDRILVIFLYSLSILWRWYVHTILIEWKILQDVFLVIVFACQPLVHPLITAYFFPKYLSLLFPKYFMKNIIKIAQVKYATH